MEERNMFMTNGDRIRNCNNEEIKDVFYNLHNFAIYSGETRNRLLNTLSCPEDLLF